MWTFGILSSFFCTFIAIADAQPAIQFRVVDIKEHIGFLVNEHNRFRGDVTPPAADMRMVGWDPELAEIAEKHASVCEFKHNLTFSTDTFEHLGENIFVGNRGVVETINEAVRHWYEDEVYHYDFETNFCNLGPTKCGHYTQLVWAETYNIGCAMTLCSFISGLSVRGIMFSCYYGPSGNVYEEIGDEVIARSPYIAGPPCSKCGYDEECVEGKLCAPIFDGSIRGPTDETTPQATTDLDQTTVVTTVESPTTQTTTQKPPSSPPTDGTCLTAAGYEADYKRWQIAMDKWDEAMEKLDVGNCL